jgi:hypothetical protein
LESQFRDRDKLRKSIDDYEYLDLESESLDENFCLHHSNVDGCPDNDLKNMTSNVTHPINIDKQSTITVQDLGVCNDEHSIDADEDLDISDNDRSSGTTEHSDTCDDEYSTSTIEDSDEDSETSSEEDEDLEDDPIFSKDQFVFTRPKISVLPPTQKERVKANYLLYKPYKRVIIENGENEMLKNVKHTLSRPNLYKCNELCLESWTNIYENGPEQVMRVLIRNKDKLQHLKSLIISDIDELQVSWIRLCDMTPILHALPNLWKFKVYGSDRLEFTPFSHKNLLSITLFNGGLSADVVRNILDSDLPNLTHLELWLGDQNYGASCPERFLDALSKLFCDPECLPRLEYLGLKNYDDIDKLVVDVVKSNIVKRISELDLSMGALGNDGASELLNIQSPTLKIVHLAHHFINDHDLLLQLVQLPFCVKGLDEAEKLYFSDDERYVSVSE